MTDSNEKKRIGVTARTQLLDPNGAVTVEYQSFAAYFDDKNNKSQEIHYNQDGTVAVKKLFDCEGLVIQELYYENNNLVGYQYLFSYDESGKETERAMLTADGVMHKKRKYVYNARQQIEQALWYNNKGVIEVVDDYEYQQATGAVIISRGEVAQWTNHYDKNGHMLSTSGGYWSDDQLYQTNFYYDPDGRLVRKEQINGASTIESMTHYVYVTT